MLKETSSARAVRVAADKARYDAACKRLLSEKVFLARIMKDCVEEYKDCDVEDIIKYIEGQPVVGKEPVMPDQSNGTQVSELNGEDVSLTEGRITYDILFQALVPGTESRVGIILNVEAQNKYNPVYPLISRALYYCSRLISSQKARVFEHSHYEKPEKVYSIWICANPPKDKRTTITRYQLTEMNQVGQVKEPVENYDLMVVVMVGLGGPEIAGEAGIL